MQQRTGESLRSFIQRFS
jgi:hypothetical protein